MSVADRFQTLLSWLDPSSREVEALGVHRQTITKSLKASFDDVRVELIGSHSRGTAVSGQSDLDLIVYLPGNEARWGGRLVHSDRVLARVRDALKGRYQATDIGKDAQAIVVSFAGGDRVVDVVPAFWIGMTRAKGLEKKRPLFKIPDGSGGWFDTSPAAHRTHLKAKDDACGGRLRRTAQILKFWAACRAHVVLTSFHVELVLAESGICRAPGAYAKYLVDVFELLSERGCRSLQDPLGISRRIPAARTAGQVERTLTAVQGSLALARRARQEELGRNSAEAYALWGRVFNGNFPSR
jgi:hypothetical protein